MNPTSPLFRTLKKQRPNSLLSSASALGLGVGLLGNSVAKADDLNTIIPPQFYQQADDGQVVLATTDGQKVILGESQYLILEDGLLVITDELAQNTVSNLQVVGSFRSSDFTFPDAVSSSSGAIIETASHQPLWSGDRPTFESLGIETYELAQNNSQQEGYESSSNGNGIGNAGLGAGFGFGLVGLISGFLGNGIPEESLGRINTSRTTKDRCKRVSSSMALMRMIIVVVPFPLLGTSIMMDTTTSSSGHPKQTLMVTVRVSPMSCSARQQVTPASLEPVCTETEPMGSSSMV